MRMRQKLRCFAERSEGVWVAYCLDLGLGAQADTFDEAKDKLEAQITDLSPQEAFTLLRQGSPLSLRLRYGYISAVIAIARTFNLRLPRRRKRFTEAVPPDLALC